jgi:hypothetical protein
MRLNFVSLKHVPHKVTIWEDDDASRDPVVINKQLAVLQAINFHPIQN